MQTLIRTIAQKIISANPDSVISTREQRKEAMKGLADKYASNPSGLLMYHPAGKPFMLGKGLGIEFPTEFLEIHRPDRRRFPLLFRFSFCAFQSRGLSISLQFMHTKLLALFLAIGLAGTCMVNAQSPSPTASPSPAKHRSHKKADATKAAAPAATSNASPAETTAASPSPAEKRTRKTKKTAAAATSPSPAAATAASQSPAAKHARKGKTTAAVSATVTPSPSPAKKTLADFFKPKSSVSPSPAPAAATTVGSRKSNAAPNVGATPAPGGGNGLVWVNTETHVYHKEGSRFYGKTKKGKYVSEADAIKEGDRAAKHGD